MSLSEDPPPFIPSPASHPPERGSPAEFAARLEALCRDFPELLVEAVAVEKDGEASFCARHPETAAEALRLLEEGKVTLPELREEDGPLARLHAMLKAAAVMLRGRAGELEEMAELLPFRGGVLLHRSPRPENPADN